MFSGETRILEKIEELNSLRQQYLQCLKRDHWTREFFEDLKVQITYHSNKIEGLTLSYGETLNFLKFGLVEQKGVNLRDISALRNHQVLLDKIFEQYNSYYITESQLKEFNRFLLEDPLNEDAGDPLNKPGEYKENINGTMQLRDGKLNYHEYMPPVLVPGAMKRLIDEINEGLENIDFAIPFRHPAYLCCYFHYVFTSEIHPFTDGNGRLARLTLNLILMKNGFPPVAIKGEPADRELYIRSLINSSRENLEPLFDIIYEELKSTMLKIIEIAGVN